MDLVKKNILSILCGVAALICLILVFYPFGPWFSDISTNISASHQVGDDIKKVMRAERFWPTLSSREEDRLPLERFPTDATVTAGKKLTDDWVAQTTKFLDTAVSRQASQLKMLVAGSLPGNAGQSTIAYSFLDQYRTVFGQKVDAGGKPIVTGREIYNAEIKGQLPPTPAEVADEQQRIATQIANDKRRIVNGVVINQEEVDQEIAERTASVARKMRQDVAVSAQVYLDPIQTFKPSPRIAGNAAPSPVDIFDAQVGLWIQQEICRAVAQANAGAKQGVLDAPIKRLIDLSFTLPYASPGAPGTAQPGAVPVAAVPGEQLALPANPAAPIKFDYARNPLGHTSNEVYDVVPFRFSIICEAESLPKTLTDLSANRYMMFRKVETLSVDSAVALQQGFLYGDKPVVFVVIDGQYLLLRRFIGPLMPPEIIQGMMLSAQPAG